VGNIERDHYLPATNSAQIRTLSVFIRGDASHVSRPHTVSTTPR